MRHSEGNRKFYRKSTVYLAKRDAKSLKNLRIFQNLISIRRLHLPIREQRLEVNDEVVTNIAELAQLKVEQGEIKSLADGMQNILDLAEQMQSIDTTNVLPVSNPPGCDCLSASR